MAEESVYGPYGAGRGAPGRPRSQELAKAPQPRMRMRERFVRWRAPKQATQAVLDPLISTVLAAHPSSDIPLL